MKRGEPCRVPGCIELAAGAWYIPSASGPPGKGLFDYALLCAGHGAEGEKRGARAMAFVPRKVRSDVGGIETAVSVEGDRQVETARRRR